jgi:hypothetical protein
MIGLITGTQQAINQGKEEWYGSYNDPNNSYLLTESANTFGGKIMQTMVNIRKPFKKYGNILPRKPDTSDHFDQNKSGPGHLFDYHELLKDSRPSRVAGARV